MFVVCGDMHFGGDMSRTAVALLLLLVAAAAVPRIHAQQPGSAGGGKQAAEQELPQLPETEVIGQPPAAEPGPPGPGEGGPRSVLEGTAFSSPPATGYQADSSTSGTMIDVPNISVPATVDVVTEDVRRDQHALQIDDLLRDIGGAIKVNDDRRPDAFFLRGFSVTSRDYRKNGFLDPTYTPRDFADVERMEVLKGPASVLYGAGQPSGIVNLITKQPLDQAMYYGGVQFGSFNLQRYTVDATGPLNESKSVLYRMIAAYQDTDSFRDFGFQERTFAAPSMAWVLDPDTVLLWQGEYVNDRRRYDTGVAAVGGQLILPISRFLGEPDNDFQQFHDYRQSLVLNHRVNEDWSWKLGGYSLFYDAPSSSTFPVAFVDGAIPPLGQEVFLRSRQNIEPFREQYQSFIAALSGKLEGNVITHNIVLGTEEGWFTSNAFHATQTIPMTSPPFPFNDFSTWLPINAASPIYGLPFNPTPAITFNSKFYQADYGLYVQDLIEVGEHWKVLAGVRYDHVDTVFDREFISPFSGFGPTKTIQTFDEGSPRVGVVYEPVPERLSYYAMHSESFTPPPGLPQENPDPLLPELGQSWEGGVKMKVLDGLSITAAGFYITRENVTQLLPSGFFVAQVGRQRSQGAEIEILGQINQRWSMVANYAYTDTLLSDDTHPEFNGQRALGVPYNMANVWTRYNVIQDEQRTLGLALGVVYVGQRLGDFVNPPFLLPDYTRWDAGIYYVRGRLDASVYFENLFDTVYYTGSVNQFEVFPGAPFNVRAQIGCRF